MRDVVRSGYVQAFIGLHLALWAGAWYVMREVGSVNGLVPFAVGFIGSWFINRGVTTAKRWNEELRDGGWDDDESKSTV